MSVRLISTTDQINLPKKLKPKRSKSSQPGNHTRSSRGSRGSTRFTATEVRNLLLDTGGHADWHTLVDASGADTPKEITQLRQMLKGLERGGELIRDASGDYRLPGETRTHTGVVEQAGTTLILAGRPIGRTRVPVRAGDEVEYADDGDEVRIVDIKVHSATPLVGILNWQGRYPYVQGMGSYKGRIELDEQPALGDDGDTVAVRIIGTARRGLRGIVTDVIEGESVLEQAVSTAVAAFDIPQDWPEAVQRARAQLPKSVQASRFKERVDLRELPLITIDGETARDFDDAVYAEKRRGGWRLIVAIADVAHYVKPGSAIDVEALQRGTSVYFPERVIPMLPEELSNELCSLKPEVDRLALVCDMEVTKAGKVRKHSFYEAVIYSHARLTYNQVEAYLNGGQVQWHKLVKGSVNTLHAVYEALRMARENRGALDFPTHEGVLVLENGRVSRVEPVVRLEAHQLIEEAMIAANVCAAEFLEASEIPSLYRVHEPPDPMKLDELKQMLAFAGVHLNKGKMTPRELQGALTKLPETANQWLFGQLTLRTMQQAVYSPDNRGHFGLALERYMHFTSPIRRYPDLLVHRAIKSVVSTKKRKPPDSDALQSLGEQTSQTERRAESAGWMVEGWLKCDYISDRVGDEMSGIIATVTDFGLFVELEDYFVQGLLHISNLGGDYYHFNARSMSLVGEKSGRRFVMGDEIRVIIREVEPSQGKIDLVPVDIGKSKGSGKGGRGRSNRRGKGRR